MPEEGRHETCCRGKVEGRGGRNKLTPKLSRCIFYNLLLSQEEKRHYQRIGYEKIQLPLYNHINSVPGIEGHNGPLKRPSSALWWSRSNLVVLHGQKNGLYSAPPKFQIFIWKSSFEEDSVTPAGELQRNTFNLHIFVMCCKISATFILLEWIEILSVFGDEPIHIMSCSKLLVLWWHYRRQW